jgi:hypothetical protein
MATNTGGRETFAVGAEFRILETDGGVSTDVYVVKSPKGAKTVRADRKGHIVLHEVGSTRTIKIHHRRILPKDIGGKAPVFDSSDKFVALCPECGASYVVQPADVDIRCCDNTHKLHWIGDKPMAVTKTKAQTPAKKPAQTKAPKPSKKGTGTVTKQPYSPDFEELKDLDGCELWSMNVDFDHAKITAQSHCLLYVKGPTFRKYHFNTYNGTTGKKGKELHVECFIADEPIPNAKRPKPWYPVADIKKAREELTSRGYSINQ